MYMYMYIGRFGQFRGEKIQHRNQIEIFQFSKIQNETEPHQKIEFSSVSFG